MPAPYKADPALQTEPDAVKAPVVEVFDLQLFDESADFAEPALLVGLIARAFGAVRVGPGFAST